MTGIGLVDDFHRLGYRVKFIFQFLGAILACLGGVKITGIFGIDLRVFHGIPSCLVTVFWFLLFINIINLIDGLDGLAAGVSFFACTVMVVLDVIAQNYYSAVLFAALVGSLLGFLRYNFNPASIFLGDGGSYFLGYTMAGLSILSSTKSQMGASVLIPIVALGEPIFDAVLSPIRRFLRGLGPFSPDKRHIHHKLIEMGFTTRKAVLMLYGIMAGLCTVAVVTMNFRNELSGLLLIILGAGAILAVRKLGYLDYFASDKIMGWVRDVRTCLGCQRIGGVF